MNEECLVCGAPLEYRLEEESMTCELCGTVESSRTCCIMGHFVCDACHAKGVDAIVGACLRSVSRDPVEILDQLMEMPFCHMHGNEHHIMVGAALLAAYRNAGGTVDLETALLEMQRRGRQVPGGTCGYWGACGAGVSVGIFVSIATGSTPLAGEEWGLSNLATARALERIGAIGGPRCCKRDSYLAIEAAVEFAHERLGVQMQTHDVVCRFSHLNRQCIADRCPYHCG